MKAVHVNLDEYVKITTTTLLQGPQQLESGSFKGIFEKGYYKRSVKRVLWHRGLKETPK